MMPVEILLVKVKVFDESRIEEEFYFSFYFKFRRIFGIRFF